MRFIDEDLAVERKSVVRCGEIRMTLVFNERDQRLSRHFLIWKLRELSFLGGNDARMFFQELDLICCDLVECTACKMCAIIDLRA